MELNLSFYLIALKELLSDMRKIFVEHESICLVRQQLGTHQRLKDI